MGIQICFTFTLCLLVCVLRVQAASKYYTDENRPYQFGFKIEGEQHREEKKDENGLIMGEFGFITADGIYHVTAYATDENGNFKILSSKNLRVRPSPFEQNRRKAHALQHQNQNNVVLETPGQSCSHCSIPTTAKSPALGDIPTITGDDPQNYYNNQNPAIINEISNQRNPKEFDVNAYNPQQQFVAQAEANVQLDPNTENVQYNPNQQNIQSDPNQAAPQLIGAQIQIVDPNTDINQLSAGEKPGLPNGVTNGDLEAIFYTFNYTVGFHGHHEEGYVSGAKKGYYYITGRNGVRTRVDYEADEKGFRPRITQEVLDIISDEVPKPETEKDDKYGLKGYEFKWLYYPVDSKRSANV